MAVLDRIRRWFIMFFIRGNKERSEGDQSIIGDISIRSSPKHSCKLTVTTGTPEKALKKVGSFIPTPQHWSQKLGKSTRCSKLPIVDHVFQGRS